MLCLRLFQDQKIKLGTASWCFLKDEYVKAYYAALYQRQLEQEAARKREQESSSTSISNRIDLERQVGAKWKRGDDDEGDEEVEWEEALPAGNLVTF